MKSRWIVGNGDYLDLALQAWKQTRTEEIIHRVELSQFPDYTFDLSPLNELNPAEGAMFVAIDERFGNFKRMELMQVAMERGFQLESFIHPSAAVDDSAVIGLNVFVGATAVIGHDSCIDYNTVIHAGAHIGPSCRIKASCWIENGVQIGARVKMGGHCIVRMGTSISPNITVGRNCELGWPRLYIKDVPRKTVFDPRYDEPIYIYEP